MSSSDFRRRLEYVLFDAFPEVFDVVYVGMYHRKKDKHNPRFARSLTALLFGVIQEEVRCRRFF